MDPKEFEVIAKEARQTALDVCRSSGLDRQAAEDVAQDTMLRLWTLHADLPPDQPIGALVAVVARHLVIDRRRRRRVQVPIDSQWAMADTGAPPDEQVDSNDWSRWLEQRLSQLPSTEYQVIHLRQMEGKSNEEIAQILGVTPASAATLLSRARKKLGSSEESCDKVYVK
jgi:RNA polymerase sigma factor (sigma-70 family)